MRNNALSLMLVCLFIILAVQLGYFAVHTFQILNVSTNERQTMTISDAVELLPFQACESSAKAMCLIEQNSGRVLYGKNIHKKLPMASTTKIFTALTVLENCQDLDEVFEIDSRAVGVEGTSIYLKKGEKMSARELLYGMMLPSGNDAATALAYRIGGNIEKFCELMQTTAKNAGSRNSSFKNPHGLDEAGHYTTAYDLAITSSKALKNEIFKEIVGAKYQTISGNEEVDKRYLKNKNKLLNLFEGATGVKTGFTDNAGRCYVSSASRENLDVVCCVLNCQPMFEECKNFMEKAFKEYKNYELLPEYNIVDTVAVEKGKQDEVKIYSQKKFVFPLTTEEFLKINYEYEKPDVLNAPIKKEECVGKVKIYLENQILFEDDLITTDEISSNSLIQGIKDIIFRWKKQ